MNKLSLLALMTAVGVAGSTVLPVQAAEQSILSSGKWNGGAYVVVGGQVCSPEDLKDILAGICDKLPNIPEINQPGTDNNTPDTNQPGADNNTPDTNQPGTDNDVPDTEALSYTEQVVALVNAERAKAGLNALTLDTEIASAALVRAKETEISFSHTRPDGRHFSTALSDIGINFRGAGENIAWGQRSPEQVMNGWMNSEGHRANILNPNYTKIGVGYYQNAAGTNYWTQLFTY
ncbi:MAG: hypothetical protein J6D08_18770 [Lachnospiraceae bacterium]|nr:hypothetical protein [Lachnospiraceae bacterium]